MPETDLLDLLAPEDGGRAGYMPVVHIITPDMATLCREDYLDASNRGDRCAISPHRDDRDRVEVYRPDGTWKHLTWSRIRWRNVTCPWCRSLGHVYYRWVCRAMQGRQA